jgi:hypothetical protein
MTKAELLSLLENVPDSAEVNIQVTGTAEEGGKYVEFSKLYAVIHIGKVEIDPPYSNNNLCAKVGHTDSAHVPLVK